MALSYNLHQKPVLVADKITKKWPLPEGNGYFTVLEDINLSIYPREVLAILGRSGSGKSTLLRVLAGLVQPSGGRVLTNGDKPLRGANADVGMVFQSFALLPWASVQENVELGLKARGISREERRKRALKAIDMVGLDGFESAYPRELSGGMQQRVGFARAFVMEPHVLFMDEPFSALDVLTAENLRGEIDDLWQKGQFPAQSVVIVTHNIEEAVLLADRVVVMGANPGRIRGEVYIRQQRPRNRNSPEFKALVDYIYTVMTNPEMDVHEVEPEPVSPDAAPRFPVLPIARAGEISGLLELLVDAGGKDDLPAIAGRLQLEADELLPILDAASLLGFATVGGGDVSVTATGRHFAETDILKSKEVFRQQVMANVPLVARMYQELQDKDNHTLRSDYFMDMLSEYYPEAEVNQQFETAVDWGRYAELFEYNASEERLYLPETAVEG